MTRSQTENDRASGEKRRSVNTAKGERSGGKRTATRARRWTHGRGQPSKMVSGKVAVRVGVAGVSSAVAAESSLPGGMGPGGQAARGRSEGCLG